MSDLSAEELEVGRRNLLAQQADVVARAIQPTAGNHGQLCPVWRKHAPLAECDCWVKDKVYDHAERALNALSEAGYEVLRKVNP